MAPKGKDTPDNMRIWDAVCTTDRANTKEVKYGRKFTAINAYSQVEAATRLFGPVGLGWGWTFGEPEYLGEGTDGALVLGVTLWYTLDGCTCKPVSVFGSARMYQKDKLDDDAHKKALTDGITKALSYLGFNADIFTGSLDQADNKYTQHHEAEAAASKPAAPKVDLVTAYRNELKILTDAMGYTDDVPDMLRVVYSVERFTDFDHYKAAAVVQDMQLRAGVWTNMVGHYTETIGDRATPAAIMDELRVRLAQLAQLDYDEHPLRADVAVWEDWLKAMREVVTV